MSTIKKTTTVTGLDGGGTAVSVEFKVENDDDFLTTHGFDEEEGIEGMEINSQQSHELEEMEMEEDPLLSTIKLETGEDDEDLTFNEMNNTNQMSVESFRCSQCSVDFH